MGGFRFSNSFLRLLDVIIKIGEMRRAGFTLIELLLVIAIVAILGTVVFFYVNPIEVLSQSRDSRRLAEISALDGAVSLSVTQNPNLPMGTSTYVYLSLPDLDGDSNCNEYPGLPTLSSTWRYACAPSSTYRKINGTGWVPINFQNLPIVPLSDLPVDPVVDSSRGLYYSFVPGWEFDAQMESSAYEFLGNKDVEGNDGGDSLVLYEKGSRALVVPREANVRVKNDIQVPLVCGNGPLNFADTYEFYSRWTLPGSGKGVITKFMLYQATTSNYIEPSESVEMALYSDTVPYEKLSESVIITGSNQSGWISSTLNLPVGVTLGKTYIFGIGPVNPGDGWTLFYDQFPRCSAYQPDSGAVMSRNFPASGGLDVNAPAPNGALDFHAGIIGIEYGR